MKQKVIYVMILTEGLGMEKFAYEIKVGDALNLHCDGWKVVKCVNKSTPKSFMIEVVFEDGTERTYFRGDRVFAV